MIDVSTLKIGDKVILHPVWCKPHSHEGKIAVVVKIENRWPHIIVSLPDFPNCNDRDYHNRFWYMPEEMEVAK